MFDVIGDINGEGRKLRVLLHLLGYRDTGGLFCHPERKCLFTGGLIDRGEDILETLESVRAMVASGEAECVLGLPEYHALCFHHTNPDRPGTPLREHSRENYQAHLPTLRQLSDSQLGDYLQWFFELPLWIEKDELRLIHACWDDAAVGALRRFMPDGRLRDAALLAAISSASSVEGRSSSRLLSGITLPLPREAHAAGRSGDVVPIRWYADPAGRTYESLAFPARPGIKAVPLKADQLSELSPYPAHERPVFFGHYRLSAKEPALLAPNVSCVDYSGRRSVLVAYRFQPGEPLADRQFVKVEG